MGFRLKKEKCATCIFLPGNQMGLRSGRVREMVKDCERRNSYVICHETLDAFTDEGEAGEAACRGYIEAGHYPQLMQIAERLGMLEEV